MRATQAALLVLYFFSPAFAVDVYLYPPPSSPVPSHLDAPHASLALAQHLGLEKFEMIGNGDGIWTGVLQSEQEGVVATAPQNGLLLTLSDEDAKGKS
jgi:hypothetical protein